MCINFVCLASAHRECVYNTVPALHIDTTALSDGTYELIPDFEGGDLEAQVSALSDGTYELIPDSEGGDLEAQASTAVLTEAPDQSSEEPRAEIVSDYREGKPRT